MGILFKVGAGLALLLFAAVLDRAAAADVVSFGGLSLQEAPEIPGAADDLAPSKWGKDLRQLTYQFLKDVRRWALRVTRLIQRSAYYWFGWLVTASTLLLFGGLVSAIDLRILAIGWRRGLRVAIAYAWIGLVVFLRLLRDPRIAGRLRLVLPIALVYGVLSSRWIETGIPLFDATDELLVVGLASRWFVRRCPDEIVEQHAAQVRQRAKAVLPAASEVESES